MVGNLTNAPAGQDHGRAASRARLQAPPLAVHPSREVEREGVGLRNGAEKSEREQRERRRRRGRRMIAPRTSGSGDVGSIRNQHGMTARTERRGGGKPERCVLAELRNVSGLGGTGLTVAPNDAAGTSPVWCISAELRDAAVGASPSGVPQASGRCDVPRGNSDAGAGLGLWVTSCTSGPARADSGDLAGVDDGRGRDQRGRMVVAAMALRVSTGG